MKEWYLLLLLIFIALIALLVIVHPLKGSKWAYFFMPLCALSLSISYFLWGGWAPWSTYQQQQVKQKQAEQWLASQSTDALIGQLKTHLAAQPSAQGWYYLGRVYLHEAQWQNAKHAFAESYRLDPKDIKNAVNYANTLFQLNQQHLTPDARVVIDHVLRQDAHQLDALAILAIDAYNKKDYQQAETYWTRLLNLLPPHSKEAKAIHKALAQVKGRKNS